jgi:hypothetical protein
MTRAQVAELYGVAVDEIDRMGSLRRLKTDVIDLFPSHAG